MTDDAAGTAEARSAGAMLRAARERQGLHIAALAAALKVPQAKLEALEAGRYNELTDATFVRALAQSVCRVLKIDAKPVLDLMPGVRTTVLDGAERSLRAPFQERPAGDEPAESSLQHRPAFWLVMLLLVAAAGFVLWPQVWGLWGKLQSLVESAAAPSPAVVASTDRPPTAVAAPVTAAPASAQQSAPNPAASAPVLTETVFSAPPPAAASPADTPAGIAVVRASEPSWVEAQDARGNVLLSRTLLPDEAVGLDGPLPLRLVIGNAAATEVTLRGKRVTLGAPNRDNVVKVELK